ncbi:MAG: DNA polymerase III subunit gamma/tau [Planctomycetia bacterium]
MAESAAYQVVARRYRPQRFDELVGQEHVARGLSGAIESGRIGHAYLFTGARGVGKTSAARIYAKALECATGPAAEPCNQCDSCIAISAGQDVDVVEIDAASNRGVEEIRQLRQNVAVRPARGRFKVYIIDEVHMRTREAFNALLKTLEEPPGHVKFVLCTTEPDKLPITILSRCQRFDFQTVDVPAIARRLAQIVEAEGAEVAPVALDLIARRAAGSMRDSQSLLEQLLGAASGPIGADDVHAVIGTGREERVGRLVAAIANRDAKESIAAFDASLLGGADPGGVLEQVIAALRDALLASVGCGPDMLREGAGLGVDLPAIGRQIGTETILAMLQIVDQALARMRTSGHAAVLAEMAIVRLANLENLDTLTVAIDRVSAAAAAAPARPRPVAAEPPREKKTTDRAREAESAGPLTPVAPGMAAAVEAVSRDSQSEAAGAAVPTAEPLAAWRQAAEAVGGLVADFAAEATQAAWRGNLLDVTIPAAAATAVTFLRRPQSISSLGTALSDIVGRDVKHSIMVEHAEPDAAAPGQARATASAPPRPPMPSQSALVRDAMEHPMVVHARTLFDAAIRKVEPSRQPAAAVPAASRSGDDGDELDHRDDDASEPDSDPDFRGGDGDG